MRCEIYGSPTSTHYTQIVGHIADDGNIYNSRNSEAGAEDLRRCVGHIAGDGNVYATAKGFGEAAGNCVGHIASDGNIYDVPRSFSAGLGHCVGHAAADGKVYTTPAGASAGLDYCVGQVLGGAREQGAAALLLLLRPRVSAGGNAASGGGASGGGGSGGGAPEANGQGHRVVPKVRYRTEGEFLRAMAFRFVLFTLLAGIVGYIFSNRNAALSAGFGLCAGVALALLFTIRESGIVLFDFDTAACKSGLLRLLFGRRAFWGLIFPILLLGVAALMLLTMLSGSAAIAVSLLAVGAAIALGAAAGTAIRRRRKNSAENGAARRFRRRPHFCTGAPPSATGALVLWLQFVYIIPGLAGQALLAGDVLPVLALIALKQLPRVHAGGKGDADGEVEHVHGLFLEVFAVDGPRVFPPLEVGGVQQFASLDDEGEGELPHPFVVRHILEMARFVDRGVERACSAKRVSSLSIERESLAQLQSARAHVFHGGLAFSMMSAIMSAIFTISGSFMPRVVTAGVPTRRPLVTKGERVSRGTVFLLAVILASPSRRSSSLRSSRYRQGQ